MGKAKITLFHDGGVQKPWGLAVGGDRIPRPIRWKTAQEALEAGVRALRNTREGDGDGRE